MARLPAKECKHRQDKCKPKTKWKPRYGVPTWPVSPVSASALLSALLHAPAATLACLLACAVGACRLSPTCSPGMRRMRYYHKYKHA